MDDASDLPFSEIELSSARTAKVSGASIEAQVRFVSG